MASPEKPPPDVSNNVQGQAGGHTCGDVLIHDLKRQGLGIAAIARKVGLDRKTVRRYPSATEPPASSRGAPGPREDRALRSLPGPTRGRIPRPLGKRLLREIRELGYTGGYSAVTDFLRDVRPPQRPTFERRFETPPGRQGQADFAER